MKFFVSAFPLFLVLFLDGMGTGLVFPMLNSIIIDPKASFLNPQVSAEARDWIFGAIVGVFMLCWFFGAAILGDLSDTLGRKKSLLICLLGSFLGYILAALGVVFKSVTIIILGRVIAGFTSGSQAIAQAAIVDLSTEKTKSRNIGFILLAVSLGFIVGPILGGLFSDKNIFPWVTFATPFYFVALISLLNAVFLLFFFKESHPRKKTIKINPAGAISIFVSAFKSKRIRFLSVFFLIFILGWSNFYTFISPFLFKKFGFPPLKVTFFMALLGLGFAIGFGVLPSLAAKYFSLKTSVVTSIFIGAFCVLATLMIPKPIGAWIMVIPMGIFISLAYTNAISIFSNQVDASSQGWIMGITGAIMALSFGIVGLSSGVVQAESKNVPLILSFSFLIISSLILSFEREGKPIKGPKL